MSNTLKPILFLLIALVLFAGCKAQPSYTAMRIPDPEDQEILVGTAPLDSLYSEPFVEWYEPNLAAYEPNPEVISALKPLLEDIEITLFMGTWCSDSKREVPRFVKILEAAGYPADKMEIITMTRDKNTPQAYEEGFGIINVPTFIFYRDDEELGRIVEYPIESLEADMLKILSGAPYRHAYDWD
ncbi:thioredoxin family protein [Robiginitalea sp. SC105]|uniref:thioredoxin family protein n=1 Tax=Robiginitalea sp. SC105 TaxID=2762332 RepID=UPI00163A42EC|nr:thioredoxin family protein [Robiginitalea sp. SC105]MBC2839041.1 thioredoxin family protein [Robiginitalea sp. SC105]